MRVLSTKASWCPVVLLLATWNMAAIAAEGFNSVIGIGGPSVLVNGVAVDGAGNSVVTGSFQGTVDFDPGTGAASLTAGGAQDTFVAKYTQAGAFVWAKSFAQSASTSGQGNSVATDANGNVFVVGSFGGTLDADPGVSVTSLVSAGGTDAFLVKLDASGTLLWASRWGGSSNDAAKGVAVDGQGNAIVAGNFQGTVDLDPGVGAVSRTSAGGTDASIQKFSPAGALLWATSLGAATNDTANAVAIDTAGSIFIGGTFSGTVDFDPGTGVTNLTSAGGDDGFILKLNSAGGFVWARRFGGSFAESVSSIASDGTNVVAVGNFQGTVDFNSGTGVTNFTSAGTTDAYVVKLDGSGAFLWASSFGSVNGDQGLAAAADSAGNTFVAGIFQNTVDFAPGPGVVNLTSSGGYDAFIVKLDSSGGYQWAEHMGGTGFDATYAMGANASGSVALAGRYQGPAAFGSAITLQNAGTISMFVATIGNQSIPAVATPTFTPGAETFSNSVNIQISCATAGAAIYYTTNGSTPTASSTAYSGPITFTSTVTLKAIAVKAGYTNSAVASAVYTYQVSAAQALVFSSNPMATPNPATVGQNVSFICASAGGSGAISWHWNFGDGSTNTNGASVTHAYITPGAYNVSVSATDTTGQTITGMLLVNVTTGSTGGTGDGGIGGGGTVDSGGGIGGEGGIPPSGANVLIVKKLSGMVKFGVTGHDSVALSGTIPNVPAGFKPLGTIVNINVSGAQTTYTLDKNGKARSANGTILLTLKTKRSRGSKTTQFAGGNVPFRANLMHGTWSDDWAAFLDPKTAHKNTPVTISVALVLNGTLYSSDVSVQESNSTKSGKFLKK